MWSNGIVSMRTWLSKGRKNYNRKPTLPQSIKVGHEANHFTPIE